MSIVQQRRGIIFPSGRSEVVHICLCVPWDRSSVLAMVSFEDAFIFSGGSPCAPPAGRGYIKNLFAFENQHPLNPEESDLFYFFLIHTKRPKSPKFQRAVSSSSELDVIQCTPRDTITLAFLLIIRQKADTRGMRKSPHIVPSVLDFALTL